MLRNQRPRLREIGQTANVRPADRLALFIRQVDYPASNQASSMGVAATTSMRRFSEDRTQRFACPPHPRAHEETRPSARRPRMATGGAVLSRARPLVAERDVLRAGTEALGGGRKSRTTHAIARVRPPEG